MNDIIVIGGSHHNTLSVFRALGMIFGVHSIKSIIVSKDNKPYVKYSKYISSYEIINHISELPELLLSKYLSKEKSIIIACSDGIASCLDMNHNRLSQYFIMPGASTQGKITSLMDKGAMAKLAIESGLNIPNSFEFAIGDINEAVLKGLSYPCITKPLISKNGAKDNIQIFYSSEEFKSYIKSFRSERIQIQDYIEKELEYQLIGCSLNGGKTVIIPGASIILRQPKNTNTGFLRYIPGFNANLESCKRFLLASEFSGLFSMEFLRGKDGKDYFMEINFRNDGNAICVTAAGMNLPYIWVKSCSGEDPTEYINFCQMREVLVMPEFNDFKNVLNRTISPLRWLSDVYHTDCFMEFSKHDQRPFWAYLAKKLKLLK